MSDPSWWLARGAEAAGSSRQSSSTHLEALHALITRTRRARAADERRFVEAELKECGKLEGAPELEGKSTTALCQPQRASQSQSMSYIRLRRREASFLTVCCTRRRAAVFQTTSEQQQASRNFGGFDR